MTLNYPTMDSAKKFPERDIHETGIERRTAAYYDNPMSIH